MSDKLTNKSTKKSSSAGQRQIAIRLDDQTFIKIDNKRVQLSEELGNIPSRSEVVRLALDAYLLD